MFISGNWWSMACNGRADARETKGSKTKSTVKGPDKIPIRWSAICQNKTKELLQMIVYLPQLQLIGSYSFVI